jgi:hypothetical protein
VSAWGDSDSVVLGISSDLWWVHSPPKVLDAFGQIGNPEKFGNEGAVT